MKAVAGITPPLRLLFVLPHLRMGGIESVVTSYLRGLDRTRITPRLLLGTVEGPLLERLPADIRPIDAAGRRALRLVPFLRRLLLQEPVDLVYAGTNAVNVAVLAAVTSLPARSRPSVVVSEHTTADQYLDQAKAAPLRRLLLRNLYPRADRLVCPLPGIAASWRGALDLPGLQAAVLPNPVLDEAALPAPSGERDPGLIAAAGRLSPEKGHDVVIDAVARLIAAGRALHLVIYGDGRHRAALEAHVARLHMQDHIRLAGLSRRLPQELSRAGVFALGSRREGFGNVVVEALAAGTPVVATDCAGPRAILDHGRFGLLVPPDDPVAMADAIARLLDDPSLQARLAGGGRDRTRDYTIAAGVAAFTALAEAVVAERRGRLSAAKPLQDGFPAIAAARQVEDQR